MVINFPGIAATPGEFTSRPAQTPRTDGFGERVLDLVREAFCGLHGHDSLLQFEQDRMFLKCVSCGHQTPGWVLDEPRPTVVARADNRRQALMLPQLIGARRIA